MLCDTVGDVSEEQGYEERGGSVIHERKAGYTIGVVLSLHTDHPYRQSYSRIRQTSLQCKAFNELRFGAELTYLDRCTTELGAFSKIKEQFEKRDTKLIGLVRMRNSVRSFFR